jgi:hypothetical protein
MAVLNGDAGFFRVKTKIIFNLKGIIQMSTTQTAAESRRKLYCLLGELPDRNHPIFARVINTTEMKHYFLETLALDLNGIEEVPAYFARAKNYKGRLPAILFNHSHGGNYDLGKDEFIQGNSYMQKPPYAEILTSAGFNALCIDHWCFGKRHVKSESETFKEMLWNGQVLWGMMVYDSIRAMDYLVSRDDIDSSRIGTLGMSMGSTMAWWLAALDTRIKVCIDICGLTDFHELIRDRGLDYHGIYYYVPSLLKHFSASDINALIAPRAHLALAGSQDFLTPPEGLRLIDENMKKVYMNMNAADKWNLFISDTSHVETMHMRKLVSKFLAREMN